MTKWLIVFLSACVGCSLASAAGPSVLFIGNTAMTGQGDLEKVCSATFGVESGAWRFYCEPSATFQSHLSNNDGRITPHQKNILDAILANGGDLDNPVFKIEMDDMSTFEHTSAMNFYLSRKGRLDDALRAGRYDIVILQGFRDSYEARDLAFQESAKALAAKVRATQPGARLIFAMPPQRQTSALMISGVAAEYRRAARASHAELAPLGLAWKEALTQRPSIHLYAETYEPTRIGTYLNACVLYATIYNRPPEKFPSMDGVTSADAALLKRIAWKVVCEHRRQRTP